jgi:hypothetical protein
MHYDSYSGPINVNYIKVLSLFQKQNILTDEHEYRIMNTFRTNNA